MGKCAPAYLQLGILAYTHHDPLKAVDLYHQAIDADPQLAEAHYRLGVAYDHMGKADEAAQEFKLHDEIDRQQAAAVEQTTARGQAVPGGPAKAGTPVRKEAHRMFKTTVRDVSIGIESARC